MATSDLVNLSGLMDNAKCFVLVRQHRWPLNHDPGDDAARNSSALCQRCHTTHDPAEHRLELC